MQSRGAAPERDVHRAAIARAAGTTPARAAAERAFTEYDAETARIIAERKREYFRLYAVYEELGLTRRAASDAVRDLNRPGRRARAALPAGVDAHLAVGVLVDRVRDVAVGVGELGRTGASVTAAND